MMEKNLVPDPNELGKICSASFDTMPKTGKPIINSEWTVMSCVALYQHDTKQITVVAIGSGKYLFQLNLFFLENSKSFIIVFFSFAFCQIKNRYKMSW